MRVFLVLFLTVEQRIVYQIKLNCFLPQYRCQRWRYQGSQNVLMKLKFNGLYVRMHLVYFCLFFGESLRKITLRELHIKSPLTLEAILALEGNQ